MIFNMGGNVTVVEETVFTSGKYAWRKYAISQVAEDVASNITKRYVADPSPENFKVYASSSIETDEVNKIFTLVSPDSWDMTLDGSGQSIQPNKYFMFTKPSGSVVFKSGPYSSPKPGVWFTSAEGAVIEPTSASDSVIKYSFGYVTVHTFEGYAISDDETTYPEDGDLDGFHYERI